MLEEKGKPEDEGSNASDSLPKLTVDDAFDVYESQSELASTVARQLAFAGIAVIWILAGENGVADIGSNKLGPALLAFVAALAFDLIQYYGASLAFYLYGRWKEWRGESEFDTYPLPLTALPILSFVSKGILVAIGYLFLAGLLWPVIFG